MNDILTLDMVENTKMALLGKDSVYAHKTRKAQAIRAINENLKVAFWDCYLRKKALTNGRA